MKHSEDVFVPECKDGPSQFGSHLRLDAWAMAMSFADTLLFQTRAVLTACEKGITTELLADIRELRVLLDDYFKPTGQKSEGQKLKTADEHFGQPEGSLAKYAEEHADPDRHALEAKFNPKPESEVKSCATSQQSQPITSVPTLVKATEHTDARSVVASNAAPDVPSVGTAAVAKGAFAEMSEFFGADKFPGMQGTIEGIIYDHAEKAVSATTAKDAEIADLQKRLAHASNHIGWVSRQFTGSESTSSDVVQQFISNLISGGRLDSELATFRDLLGLSQKSDCYDIAAAIEGLKVDRDQALARIRGLESALSVSQADSRKLDWLEKLSNGFVGYTANGKPGTINLTRAAIDAAAPGIPRGFADGPKLKVIVRANLEAKLQRIARQPKGDTKGLRYALSVVNARRILNRPPAFLAALDEIEIHIKAAIQRVENGEPMEALAHVTCSQKQKRTKGRKRGKWRLQWRNRKDDTIRQEWFPTALKAGIRSRKLERGGITAELFLEE